MIAFIVRRCAEGFLTTVLILSVVFFVARLAPGDPFEAEVSLAPESHAELRHTHGLDEGMGAQYWAFLKQISKGDLGYSYSFPGKSVNDILREGFAVSIELAFWALCVSLTLGIAAGILASSRPYQWPDYSLMGLSAVGVCIPSFVTGPLLVLLLCFKFPLLSFGEWATPSDRILPALTLGLFYVAYVSRLTRSGIMDVREEPYMIMARAKGLSQSYIFYVHGLKNALQPVLNALTPIAASMASGSFIVETFFGVPGLGNYYVSAIFNRDYNLITGVVLNYALFLIAFNILVDVLSTWLNPKQSYAESG